MMKKRPLERSKLTQRHDDKEKHEEKGIQGHWNAQNSIAQSKKKTQEMQIGQCHSGRV